MIVHTCNPSYSGSWGRRIARTWEGKVAVSRDHMPLLSSLGSRARHCLKKKKKKTTAKRKAALLGSETWVERCFEPREKEIHQSLALSPEKSTFLHFSLRCWPPFFFSLLNKYLYNIYIPGTSQILSFDSHANQWGVDYCHPCFIDEEAEVQRAQVTCPK